MINWILVILIVLSQTLIVPDSFRWIKEYSAFLLAIGFFASLLWKKNKFVAMFLLWSVALFVMPTLQVGYDKPVTSFFINDAVVPFRIHVNLSGFFNLVNIILFSLLYYLIRTVRIKEGMIAKGFCFVAGIQSVYIILQKLQLDQFFYNSSLAQSNNPLRIAWPVGFWANETLVSWCIAICAPFLLGFNELRYKILYALSFVAILLTGSSTGLIAFVIGFCVWLFYRNWKVLVSVGTLGLVGVGVIYLTGHITSYLDPTNRFDVWVKAIKLTLEQCPTFGHGLGSFRTMFWFMAPEFAHFGHWAQAHNEIVQIFFEHGIIGVFIVALLGLKFLYNFIKTGRGLIPFISVLSGALCALNGFPFRTAMGVLIVIAFALYERCVWQDEGI